MSFRRILAAIDHSPLENRVFRQAADLAQSEGAELLLAHCVDARAVTAATAMPGTIGGTGVGLYPTAGIGVQPAAVEPIQPVYPADWDQTLQQEQNWLKRYQAEASDQGIPAQIDCQFGVPNDYICDLAKTWPADLVVIGRRGRQGLTEVFLGSVSNHVVHHAPCAVLVIQGEPAESI